MAAVNLKSKTARAKLTPQKEPYWERMREGLHLGYRRIDEAGGSWTGRRAAGTPRFVYQVLGNDSDLSYDEACAAVLKWAQELSKGIQNDDRDMTVSDVCRSYVKYLHEGSQKHPKRPKTARDSELRFERLVYNAPFGAIKFAELKKKDVSAWHISLVGEAEDEEDEMRHKDSANRNLKTLKAALNYGLHSEMNKLVKDDSRWKAVNQFRGVGARRGDFLTPEQRKIFLNAMPEDLRIFATALLLTGARPGEMANAKVPDYDKKAGILKLSGKTGKREVYLNDQTRAFFDERIKDKIGTSFIFVRADGVQWQAPMWGKMVREIQDDLDFQKRLGLKGIVLYHLRHAYISESLAQGIDIFAVAKLCGTSAEIIQKHYGHLVPTNIRERLNMVSVL